MRSVRAARLAIGTYMVRVPSPIDGASDGRSPPPPGMNAFIQILDIEYIVNNPTTTATATIQ